MDKKDNLKTMSLNEVIAHLKSLRNEYGNVHIVLFDNDNRCYYTLADTNFEAQKMKDGSTRISIGVNDYNDQIESFPEQRPI